MCEDAPRQIVWLEHRGCIFSRMPDGRIAQRPFGGGLITHPLTVYCGLALAGLLILRFAGERPLVSDRSLAAGVVLGIASYFLGTWFGTALLVVR